MQTLQSLSELWQTYFLDLPQVAGADTWSIVFMVRDGNDLLVSLANPFTEEHTEVFVTNVSQSDIATFTSHYKQRFGEQLPARFGFFRPDVNRVLTEYPDWQTFYSAWLQDDVAMVQGNMPLLFDYPSEQEYRAMQLKQADYAGYRRLLIVLYQYRKRQFQKVFIKQVADKQYEHIQQQILQLYKTALPHIIYSEQQP